MLLQLVTLHASCQNCRPTLTPMAAHFSIGMRTVCLGFGGASTLFWYFYFLSITAFAWNSRIRSRCWRCYSCNADTVSWAARGSDFFFYLSPPPTFVESSSLSLPPPLRSLNKKKKGGGRGRGRERERKGGRERERERVSMISSTDSVPPQKKKGGGEGKRGKKREKGGREREKGVTDEQ